MKGLFWGRYLLYAEVTVQAVPVVHGPPTLASIVIEKQGNGRSTLRVDLGEGA